jgi:Tfp pilus assembly protein PilO
MFRTIISIVGVLGAIGIFFFYTRPTYDDVQVTQSKIVEYDAALQKAAELQALKQDLLKKYNAFNPNDLDRLKKLLPDHVDNVRLILDLDSLAQRHAMAVQNVVVTTQQVDSATQSAVGAISSSKQGYDSITMKFTTQSTYPTFQQFLSDLESSLRIVDLVSLKITPSTDGSTGKEPGYSFDVTIKTYWLK